MVGVPKVVAIPKREKILAVRIGPALWRRLLAVAYRQEMTVAEVTRYLLAQALSSEADLSGLPGGEG
jgi:hypothetical protein